MTTHNDLVPNGTGACVFYCYEPGKVPVMITLPPLTWNQNSPSKYWFGRPGEIIDYSAAYSTRVVQFGFQFHLTANIPAMKADVASLWIQGIIQLQLWLINHPNVTGNPDYGIYCFPHIDNQDAWFKVMPVGDFHYDYINGRATGLSSNFDVIGLDILTDIPIGTSIASQWGSRTIAYDSTIDYPFIHQWAKRTGDLIDFGCVPIAGTPANWTLDAGLTLIAERFTNNGQIFKAGALTGAGGGKALWNFTVGTTTANPTIYAFLRPRQGGGDTSFGLIFREQAGTGNHYYYRLDTTGKAYLIKNIGGADTTLATFTGLGTWLKTQYPVWAKIVPLDNLIKLYLAKPNVIITPLYSYPILNLPNIWNFIGSVTDATITTGGASGIRTGAGSEMDLIRYYDSLADYATTDYSVLGQWTARTGRWLPFTP